MVGLQTGDVDGEGFDGEVGATGVNTDADGGGVFAGDAGFLGDSRRCQNSSGQRLYSVASVTISVPSIQPKRTPVQL